MARFSDRFPTAFVTGGSSGLGRVLVEGLLAEGVEVWAGSRSTERIKATGLAVHPVALDLANGRAVESFLQDPPWERRPVLLVNNAGFGQFGPLASVPPEDLAAQVTAMLESAMKLSQMFLEDSRAGTQASAVVNISSLAVEFPLPYLHGYNAVKAGLSGFSRSLALEFPGGQGKPFVIDLRPGDYRTGFNEAVRNGGNGANSANLQTVWDALEHHLQNGADPGGIWPPVRSALRKQRSRTLRVGTFFQAKFAPMMARFFPGDWVAWVQKRYYRMNRSGGNR